MGRTGIQKCSVVFYKLIIFVTFFLNIFILIGTVTNAHDKVFKNLFSSVMRFILPVMLAIMICTFIAILYHYFDLFNHRQLILSVGIMFGIMIVNFVVILCNFRSIPYSDALNIQDTAMYFVKTGQRPIAPDAPDATYFGRYSNNYFLTVLFVYIFKIFNKAGISDIYTALQVFTVTGIIIAAVFMYLIGVRIGGIRQGAKILALCVMNPVYYIMVLWVYTNIISIPFMMAVIYFGICIYQEKRKGYWLFACIMEAVISVIGYFIRPTAVIPLIALVICAILWAGTARKNAYKLIKCSVICILIGAFLFQSVSKLNDSYFSSVSEGNYPVTHWIMMGSHGEGRHNIKDVKYTKSFDGKKEKVKATVVKTIENYRNHGKTELVSFFGNKLLFSWGQGDGAEIIPKASQDTKQTKLYSWILGDRADLFRLYCYAFRIANIILIIAALWRLLKKKETDVYQFVFVLSLFGGILFYCIWEIKGSYTAPFIYIMLLIGMQGGSIFAERISGAGEWLRTGRRYPEIVSVLAFLLCICTVGYSEMTSTVITRRDWSLCCYGSNSVRDIEAYRGVSELSQEFYASKPINRIALRGKADKDAEESDVYYQVKLLDENKREVYIGEIHAGDIKPGGIIELKTDEIVPEGRQKYILQLYKMNDGQGEMIFQQRSNEYIDTYEGVLTVNGIERMNDLYLQAYKEYESKWCSRKMGAAINGGIFIIAFLMFLCLWNGGDIMKERGRKDV